VRSDLNTHELRCGLGFPMDEEPAVITQFVRATLDE
jgi:hypothetical protein